MTKGTSEQERIRKALKEVFSDLFMEQIEGVAFDLLFMEWLVAEKTSNTKKERAQQAIEQASYDLFMKQGFTATSMRQIADGAGLALGGSIIIIKARKRYSAPLSSNGIRINKSFPWC